jgi:pimeloyl-ACP methyl ester carboxylesterase
MARTLARAFLSVLVSLQLLCSYLLTVDAALGAKLQDPTPRIVVTHENVVLPHRAVVFLTGTQSSGLTHSSDIQQAFWKLGSFVVVEYNPEAFDMQTVIETLLSELHKRGFTEIYLFGSSLGGLVGLNIVARNHKTHEIIILGTLLSNVPRGLVDLFDQRAKVIAKIRRVGPLGNRLLGPIMGLMFNPPPPGPGANLSLLRRHHQASKAWPVSGWIDEVRTIVNQRDFQPEELRPVHAVLIVAAGDNVVKPEATEHWQQLLQVPNNCVLHVNSGHEQYVDDPLPWYKVMQQAARLLATAC